MKKGDYVKISDDYSNCKLRGCVGYIGYPIFQHKSNYSLGVHINRMSNPKSSKGLFWIPEQYVIVITEQEYIIGKEEKNMLEDSQKGRCDCNINSERTCEPIKLKEAPNNVSVVNLYFERETAKINNIYSKRKEELIAKDSNIIAINSVLEKIKNSDSTKIDRIENSFCYENYITIETKEALLENDKARVVGYDKLADKKHEIIALLSGCQSYSDEMQILRGYNIVKITDSGITM